MDTLSKGSQGGSIGNTGSGAPPSNLPIVTDDEKEIMEIKETPIAKASFVPANDRPVIVPMNGQPGTRGPLPSMPGSPLKISGAKFGVTSKLKEEKETDQAPKIPAGKPLITSIPAKPKLQAPLAPRKPGMDPEKTESANEKPSQTPSIPSLPTVPVPAGVDRNIRPRRLAILLVVLIAFIILAFSAIWFFFLRANSAVKNENKTDGSLLVDGSPAPSADQGSGISAITQDSDGDGLTDQEEQALGTNPIMADTDSDGFADKQELESGFDPITAGGKLDSDRDGLSDPDEICWTTDKQNPDTDGDGYLDGQEVVNRYDPVVASPNDKITGTPRCQ